MWQLPDPQAVGKGAELDLLAVGRESGNILRDLRTKVRLGGPMGECMSRFHIGLSKDFMLFFLTNHQ